MTQLAFEQLFTSSFEPDPSEVNQPRQVRALYSWVKPTPVPAPRIIAWSPAAAQLLGLERPPAEGEVADILGGNRHVPGSYASCYGGHQFGTWARQLGDGRALGLGEIKGWEVQLKGAGPTPYSRHADGRAVLRSSIREFLCSELMHFLGVPTTRALALVATGEPVLRDMFYDGRPEAEPGAVCTRLSPSFLRFGHFELLAFRQDRELMEKLLTFVCQHYYAGVENWFAELCRRTAELMVHWLRVGFVHGVMNTDNMSILGLTIDYGPYGWLDVYDPYFTPNTTDRGGRYAYAEQGEIGLWNLERLAGALSLVMEVPLLEAGLETYVKTFQASYPAMQWAKLGLAPGPDAFLREQMAIMHAVETDFTNFYRLLGDEGDVLDACYQPPSQEHRARVARWLEEWRGMGPDRVAMKKVNPRVIPRNFVVQEIIKAADPAGIERMLEDYRLPYEDGPPDRKRPEWARSAPGCSALSCSS